MSNDDILVGMKEISEFLKVGRNVVSRWMKECADFPVAKDGQLMANATDLSEWHRLHVRRKKSA